MNERKGTARKASDIDEHRESHQKGGSDEIDCTGLKGIDNHKIITGVYLGDGKNNRQIKIGFKCSLVFILCPSYPKLSCLMMSNANPIRLSDNTMLTNGTRFHHTDGFIVCGIKDSVNKKGVPYNYWAIGENKNE